MDVVEDPAQRALLAEVLLAETKPPEPGEVESAIQEIQERAIEGRQRDLRAQIAEAERRGDFAELALLPSKSLTSTARCASCTTARTEYNRPKAYHRCTKWSFRDP